MLRILKGEVGRDGSFGGGDEAVHATNDAVEDVDEPDGCRHVDVEHVIRLRLQCFSRRPHSRYNQRRSQRRQEAQEEMQA